MPTAFHLGFQVRVELILADGAPLTTQITRDEEELLELDRYPIVDLRPHRTRTFSSVA